MDAHELAPWAVYLQHHKIQPCIEHQGEAAPAPAWPLVPPPATSGKARCCSLQTLTTAWLRNHPERGKIKKIGRTLPASLQQGAGLVKHTRRGWCLIRHRGLICPWAGSRSHQESKPLCLGGLVAPQMPLEKNQTKTTTKSAFHKNPPLPDLSAADRSHRFPSSLPVRLSQHLNVSMVRDLHLMFCLSALDKSFQNPTLPSDAGEEGGGSPWRRAAFSWAQHQRHRAQTKGGLEEEDPRPTSLSFRGKINLLAA